MLCAKCGQEIERGTTYWRNKDGSSKHAKGDFCPKQECLGCNTLPSDNPFHICGKKPEQEVEDCACKEPHISPMIIHTKERCYLAPVPKEAELHHLAQPQMKKINKL